MNDVVYQSTTKTPHLSLRQRFRQYQPTQKLVKLVLYWWLVVVTITGVLLSHGFGMSELASLSDFMGVLLVVCQLVLAVLAVVCIFDALLLRAISQSDSYRLQREYPNNVAIFHPLDITVLLSFLPDNLSSFSASLLTLFKTKQINLAFYDDYPQHLKLNQPMPITMHIELDETTPLYDDDGNEFAEGCSKQIRYPTQPIERGTGYFGAGALRVTSPFGLFRRQLQVSQATDNEHTDHYLRVLADFTGLLTNKLSAVFEKSFDAGIQTIKEQGQGSEFLKLREYAVGDSMRQIDWKSSSRQGRIMSKSYEDENDQDVVFLLDCSEQMRHKESSDGAELSSKEENQSLSYFDKVLNAVLLLSYVANKQGDRVGLMTFGRETGDKNGTEEKFIAPKKGASLIRHLLNETADIMPTMQTSDYFKASQALKKSIKKRSLVIVITNTRQEASDDLVQAMQLLSRQHQLVFANLSEQSVQDVVNQTEIPMNMDDSLLYHSLNSYQQTRSKLHKLLAQKTGAMCLATTANKLPLVLTEAYLSIRK